MFNSTYRYNYGNYCGAEVQHGLYNQGSTCYLNSVLQVLFRTEDFRAAVERHCHENTAGGNCLDCRLQSLFKELKWRTAKTHSITKCLGIDRVYEQQDAAEYFEKILSLTSSHVSQVFRGLLTNRTICSSCGTEMDSDGPFWDLPLALVDTDSELYSVVNGIEDYFREKHFRGENQLYCDSCHAKSDAVTKRVIKNHPEVLMLLLKRFTLDYKYMQYIKINSDVIIPDTLHIPENQSYKLYAVVDHFGSLGGGHYSATINVNGEWYTFNDSSVTKTRQVEQKSSSAYLLFYRKTKGCDDSSSGVSLEPSASSEQPTGIPPSGPSRNPTAEDEPVSTDPADRQPPRTGVISKIVGVMRWTYQKIVGASADSVKEEPCNSSTEQDLPPASSAPQASAGKVPTAQDELSSVSSTTQTPSQISAPTSDTEDKHRVDSTSERDETSEMPPSGPSLITTAEDDPEPTGTADRQTPQTELGERETISGTLPDHVGASAKIVKEEQSTSFTGQDLPSASSAKHSSSGMVPTPQDELPSVSSTTQMSSQNTPPTSDIKDKHGVDSTSERNETSVHTADNGTQNIREVSTTGNFSTPKTDICVTDDRNDSSPQDTDCRRRDDVKQIFIHQKEERRRAMGVKRDKEGKTEGSREMTPDIRIMLQEAQRHSSGHSEQKESNTEAHGKEKSSGNTRLTKYDICFPKPGTDSNITDNTMINHQTCRQRPRSRFEICLQQEEEKKEEETENPGDSRAENSIQIESQPDDSPDVNGDSKDKRHGSKWRERFLLRPLKLQKTKVTTSHHKHKDKRQTSTVKAQVVSPNVQEMTGSFSDPHATRGRTGKVSQSGRVLHGLYDQGGTSYLNCVLQVLFMTKEIHDRLTETQTDCALKELFNDLQNKTCGTETITRCLSFYDVFKQRDAANCLELILRHISEEASEVFQGQLSCITRCCKKHTVHEESKKFWIFPLSLKHGPDRTYCVEESFQDFFKPETFTGNSMLCGQCIETETETRPHMCECPPILTVLLKAFDFDDRSDVKSKCPVKVPRSLELGNKTYELYGIVDHTGSLRAGHYTATILSSEDNTWYQFNDEHVSKLQVHEQPFVHGGYYNSQNAYLLMYRALTSNMGSIYQVRVTGMRAEMIIDLCNTEEQMQKMTVLQLKEKIIDRLSGHDDVEDFRLIFKDKMLNEDSALLSSYGIQHKSMIHLKIRLHDEGWLPPPPRPRRRRSIERSSSF